MQSVEPIVVEKARLGGSGKSIKQCNRGRVVSIMIDPELKYCQTCDDEYRADMEKCGVCGRDLISGQQLRAIEEARRQQLESRQVELRPDDDLVNLRKGPLLDMKHISNLLRAERIGSLVVGDEGSCGKGCCAKDFFLQVRRQDAMDAVAILEKEHRRATGLDYHDVRHADNIFNPEADEAVCPACGHAFATSNTVCPDCGLSFG